MSRIVTVQIPSRRRLKGRAPTVYSVRHPDECPCRGCQEERK